MTISCARSQSSLPAHQSASSAGASPDGGLLRSIERLNTSGFILVCSSRQSNDGLPPWLGCKSPCGAFDHGSEGKQGFFLEWPADQLQPQRQPIGIEPSRDRNPRQPGHV